MIVYFNREYIRLWISYLWITWCLEFLTSFYFSIPAQHLLRTFAKMFGGFISISLFYQVFMNDFCIVKVPWLKRSSRKKALFTCHYLIFRGLLSQEISMTMLYSDVFSILYNTLLCTLRFEMTILYYMFTLLFYYYVSNIHSFMICLKRPYFSHFT